MSLPEQLQKQVAEAQTILEQHYGTDEATADKADDKSETSAVQNVAEPQADEAASTHSPRQEVTPAEDENSQTYAQRWRSLQGVYNSVVSQNRQLEGRIGQLESLISTMSQATPANVSADDNRRFLTDEDKENFGEDMVDFAKRAVAEATAPLQEHIRRLEANLSQMQGVVPTVQRMAQAQAVTNEERFFNELSGAVPDWKAVNGNQQFHNWLLATDPMTGIARQTYLEDAQRSMDVARVANIFNSWKELSGTSARTATQGKPNSARSELERQVAPGRSASAPTTPNAEAERRYTPADITKFYDDVRRGAYRGNEAERDAIERDIFVAQREGRIVR